MRARVRARGRTENNFRFHNKQKKDSHAPIVTAQKHTTPRLQGKHTETARSVSWFRKKSDFSEKKSDISEKKSDFSEKKSDISEKKSDISEKISDISEKKSDILKERSGISERARHGLRNNSSTEKKNGATRKASTQKKESPKDTPRKR